MDKTDVLARAKALYGKNDEIKNNLKWIKTGDSNFKYLAEALIEEVNDLDLAKDSLACALEEAEGNFAAVLDVAVAAAGRLNDKTWGAAIAQSICDQGSSVSDWVDLGQFASNSLGDKEWTKEIYDRAADAASSYRDFKTIAISAYRDIYLNDEKFAREMILKGVSVTEDVYELVNAAEFVADKVDFSGDVELARQIINDAIAKTSDADDIDYLQSSLASL